MATEMRNQWSPLEVVRVKINIDGRLLFKKSKREDGDALRDSTHTILGTAAGRIEKANDALLTESVACVKPWLFSRKGGFTARPLQSSGCGEGVGISEV